MLYYVARLGAYNESFMICFGIWNVTLEGFRDANHSWPPIVWWNRVPQVPISPTGGSPQNFFIFFALNLVSIQNRGIFLSPSAWDRITARAGLVTR